ncbi:MAG TPA: hypothetical protein VG413_08440 [Candidatus Dormibacteraeota bacterium]|jgi:hypothetical protein|nr:hypothetical protein [Candidatus Dormibacteraeota bacterium]
MEPPDFMKRIIDFDRLLEGENRDNFDADDVRHWRAVYNDLVRFKEGLLGQTRELIEQVPDTKKELAGVDIPFLEAEMKRLRRGLTFWQSR